MSLVTLAPAAHAQSNFFPNNTTLNASNPVTGDAIIGYANQTNNNNRTNPTSPTVNLVRGGSVSGLLIVNNSSTVNVSGGSVGNILSALNNSVVNLSGGSIANFEANQSGTLNIFGMGLTTILVNSNNSGRSQYSPSGTLSDSTVLVNKTLYVQNGTGAKFTLNNTPGVVPEPGSVALLVGLTTVCAGLLRKRQARKQKPI